MCIVKYSRNSIAPFYVPGINKIERFIIAWSVHDCSQLSIAIFFCTRDGN
jgi:hypothetical protein